MAGDFLAKIKLALEGKDQVVTGLKETQAAAQQLSKTRVTTTYDKEGLATGKQIEESFTKIKDTSGKASTGMLDFGRAMKRALIVAPVWMALRAAMQFFIQGVQEGIQYLLDFDKQMLLVEQTLRGFGDSAVNITDLKDEFISLSQETGKSTALIAKNYLEIVKASGSVAGAAETVKVAVEAQEVAQSESVDISKALALAIKLQGDSFSKTATQQEKYKEVAATLYVLASKNLVSFEDLAKEYNSFVPIGEAANMTFQETAAVLATLNSAGVQNVQGLKTALLRTLADSEKIGKELGIAITPDTKPIELFFNVLSRFKGALKAGGDLKAFGALGETFGKGGRGGSVIIKVLADTVEQLNKNLADTKFPTENAEAFNKSLKEIQESIPHQIELFQNLKKQAFESFVIGVTGGQDFAEALKNVNGTMVEMIRVAGNLGAEVNLLAKGFNIIASLGTSPWTDALNKQAKILQNESDLYERITKALKGQLTLAETIAILSEVKTSGLIKDEALRNKVSEQLQDEATLLAKNGKLEEHKRIEAEKTVITLQKQQKELDREKDKLTALVFQYEKANIFDRERIKRQMELQAKTPEQALTAFKESDYDKNLILENIGDFTKEVKETIANYLASERGLTAYTDLNKPTYEQMLQSPILNQNVSLGGIVISINPDSIQELIDKATNNFKKYLEDDPELQKLIAFIAGNTTPKR